MSNPMGLTPQQLQTLLNMASSKLDVDPQKLKASLESGSLGKAAGKLSANQQAQLSKVLQNPQQLEQYLNSPQVKNMLQQMLEGK